MNSVDMQDWQACHSLFADEFEVDVTILGIQNRRRMTADEWIESVRRFCTQLKSTQHMSTNHLITIDGDEATCISSLRFRASADTYIVKVISCDDEFLGSGAVACASELVFNEGIHYIISPIGGPLLLAIWDFCNDNKVFTSDAMGGAEYS